MNNLNSVRNKLTLHLNSTPQYEDLKFTSECSNIIEPMMDYMDCVVETGIHDTEVDSRIFKYIPVLFLIYPGILKIYLNNYIELETYCMCNIVSEFHDQNVDKTDENVVNFLSTVEKKNIVIKKFVVLRRPYFSNPSFDKCIKSVNTFLNGLKKAFEIIEPTNFRPLLVEI